MARVSGMKEKLHMPLYDAFFVPGQKNGTEAARFEEKMTDPRLVRFFVDVQNKTRLETNLQAAGVLPSLNSFEARALRVVVSSVNKARTKDGEPFELSDGFFLAELIYNSVTSLLVGEKIMIEIPTFWFPSGAGVSPGTRNVTNHGEPDPMATFRFAEPVFIESQQNFRVEMSFPQDVPQVIKDTLGPLRIWVVLDGYLTRDVQ
jgi:hypothetical protein